MPQDFTICVVDDDDSVRESLDGWLKSIGFPVQTFASAGRFLEAESIQKTNCLILDLHMPGMSGLELQEELTARKFSIPVIFITAHGDESMRERAISNGAIAFLVKPFTDEGMMNAIDAALSSRRGNPDTWTD